MSLVVILNDEYRAKYFNILKTTVCVKSILNFDVIYIFYSLSLFYVQEKVLKNCQNLNTVPDIYGSAKVAFLFPSKLSKLHVFKY